MTREDRRICTLTRRIHNDVIELSKLVKATPYEKGMATRLNNDTGMDDDAKVLNEAMLVLACRDGGGS